MSSSISYFVIHEAFRKLLEEDLLQYQSSPVELYLVWGSML